MKASEKFNLYTLSRPSFDEEAFERFLLDNDSNWIKKGSSTHADRLLEGAGRLCYMAFGKGAQSERDNNQYIGNLIDKGHESVLEHISWTFLITGVSRAFTHQLVRHRAGFSFSQLSQQYHDESNTNFIEPNELKNIPELHKEWEKLVQNSLSFYKKLAQLDLGSVGTLEVREKKRLIRSIARSVLPNATSSKIVVTANARAIRHFLLMRGNIGGDPEMRMVSRAILKEVKLDAPATFQDFELSDDYDSIGSVVKVSK
ncbi:FAD-dependent thymidylate synthase [Idiomarina sp.]|uniref:FAD-dependent thymidylate synthase n=1 Tax=Idiomarina sp. TaxID=1874361 RepID=UPI0025C5F2AA|nr:FAD-dependent thymidylate synthase [Idiomarina sp.]NQZ04242.1 FAD-dependent thymidylate synthase [Idiomarina sp.]